MVMRYRKLGQTDVEIGIVGLGAEYLERASKDTVISVVNVAMDAGVNYIDLFMASPDVRDNFGIALRNKRHKVMVAGHIGSGFGNDQYYRTRDRVECRRFFVDLLQRLRTDYIDVLMLHYVDEVSDYRDVFGSGGLLELAQMFQKEGKVRFIGLSSHRVPTALQAVNSGSIDVLMFPVNPVFDMLPGEMRLDEIKLDEVYDEAKLTRAKPVLERLELYHVCKLKSVGIVAMKPYAAGRLFALGNPSAMVLTPVQCLSYALAQPGVCTVVPGCKNAAEMKAALSYLTASVEARDFSEISKHPVWRLVGSCMYCNHCLPCPFGIDIGTVTRLIDAADYGVTDEVVAEYESLTAKASDCTECGICLENCPFGVNIVLNMTRARDVFGV